MSNYRTTNGTIKRLGVNVEVVDLNTFTESGIYYATQYCTNGPIANYPGYLHVEVYDKNNPNNVYMVQTFQPYDKNRYFRRFITNGVIGDWIELSDENVIGHSGEAFDINKKSNMWVFSSLGTGGGNKPIYLSQRTLYPSQITGFIFVQYLGNLDEEVKNTMPMLVAFLYDARTVLQTPNVKYKLLSSYENSPDITFSAIKDTSNYYHLKITITGDWMSAITFSTVRMYQSTNVTEQ